MGPGIRHPAAGSAPPAVPGEELQQRRRMWSATRPQASAGTSLDQAVLRLDAASHRVLRKGTSPRPSRPYVDNPTKPVSFNRVPTFSSLKESAGHTGCRLVAEGAVGMLASARRERGVVRAGRVSSALRGEAPSGSVLQCRPVSPMQAGGLPRPAWQGGNATNI